ncbi:MAG: hypothetical protein PWP45_1359 [Tepidanaerobacteraceae bacterium]|nr:hypothetical protein [Tepidanaerobacteraceae bacterium]
MRVCVKVYDICEKCSYYVPGDKEHCKISSLVREVDGTCDSYKPNYEESLRLKVCWSCKHWNMFHKPYMCWQNIPFGVRKKQLMRDDVEYMTCENYEVKESWFVYLKEIERYRTKRNISNVEEQISLFIL